jgi:septal ring factor EnvC (AmiA/AmiB activator)
VSQIRYSYLEFHTKIIHKFAPYILKMPKFFISLIFLLLTSILWCQESQQAKLESQKAKIQREIKENETKLQAVKKQEKTVTKVIALQSNKIKLKEELISTTEKQSKLLENTISLNQAEINKLEEELQLLKADYAKMIVKSYKSRSEKSRTMFIVCSKSFLQAYKRFQYMKQYTNFRKRQGLEIQFKTNELCAFNSKLDIKKNAKEQLITENNQERLSLEKEKIVQEKLVDSLKKDKNNILAEIKKKQKESKAIDRKIDRLIREAIAEANRKAAREKAAKDKAKSDAIAKEKAIANAVAKAKAIEKARAIVAANAIAAAKAKANSRPVPKPIPIPKEVAQAIAKVEPTVAPVAVSSTRVELTSVGRVDSDNFKANRGRLPWPVERGYISLGYGDQTHPLYKTLVIHNSGLEFATDSGANARAVFAGIVTSVIIISPVNKLVMLQHGDFFTIYQNLSTVNVNKGDKVSIRQSLGKIKTNGDGKTILKFAITQNTNYTNPKTWLAGK